MSVWSKEVIKVDGHYKAYIGVQNDFTGQINYRLYTIYLKDNDYYVTADGRKVIVTSQRRQCIEHEELCKKAIDFYNRAGGSNY